MIRPWSWARNLPHRLAISAVFSLTLTLGYITWHSRPARLFSSKSTLVETVLSDSSTSNISDIIQTLYEPLKLAPAEPLIRLPDGTSLELFSRPRFTERLGSDVLILDLDTRDLESTKAFRRGRYDWGQIGHISGGVFSHYTYALVHGYDYKFIHASQFEDRHVTWIKPSALANHIDNYKLIVFLDADATFRFLHLPIEWLLNYWNIEPHLSIVMVKDPWDPHSPQYNSDRFNRTYTNTGFIIVQNNENSLPILKAWHECPDDTRYPGCSEWKQPKFPEQSAFGEYVRYDYEDYIKELDCGQANGFPGVQISDCQGKFVRHYWFEKHLAKADYQENMLNALALPVRKLFSADVIMKAITRHIQKLFADGTGIVFEQKENIIHA